ncbi:hypothetical protein DVT68_17240 [Dyella solisilvae]|uniref:Lipid A biosynthesis N-terminal domain-containing protein n=1 Tax=Dyella solisilvae TaxID=1920168 RepID=A0A370K4A4_9GAMM|nr:lipid-A-disaccharide synthase N-terminal domain-containing protein [Dyella solisilvae]RDI97485.1 hypothetical protein DVT68_17240 [Dyella solisilvae]
MAISYDGWLILGICGQVAFSARFLLQWLYSEYKRYSAVPIGFWYMSIIGGGALLAYAIHLKDPVFIVGQTGGVLIYVRNLQLRLRERRRESVGATT